MKEISLLERKRGKDPEWYNEILLKAEIYDYRYPVKGTGVWLPYGLEIMDRIFSELEKMLDEDGHRKILLPEIIPESIFSKESEHIRGFEGEVFWITQGGSKELKERLLLRPTSETILYHMLKLWLRNYKQLPIKIYQRGKVFRYETKATRPLLREREIYWNEAHCVHLTHEESWNQVLKALEIYQKLFREICALENILVLQRPEWDKFAGARVTFAIDAYIELSGKALQIGTSHDLHQNFTKAYGIAVKDAQGREVYPYSNSYGISCRVLGAIILTHSDDRGLILPPRIAPIQVIIVPIPYKGQEEKILEVAKEIKQRLQRAGFRVELDASSERPGWKFYYWEMKGVPLRIELGPRDLQESKATLARRDTGEKLRVSLDALESEVSRVLDDIQANLRNRSRAQLENAIVKASTLDEIKQALDNKKIVKIPFCSVESDGKECAEKIKESFSAEVLGVAVNEIEKPKENERCPVCGRKATVYVYVAKKY